MAQLKSQIRQSEIDNLFQKVSDNDYGKYLKQININKLRGLHNQEVEFIFPVTAIIGLNGSGKSTVLGAAALLYKSEKPSKYFLKGGNADLNMVDWKVGYSYIDKSLKTKGYLEKSAKFTKAKWTRDAADRTVLHFGVNRTVPIMEKEEFRNLAKSNAIYVGSPINGLVESVKTILGRPNNKYSIYKLDKNSIHGGTNENGEIYSEFHFGAGEASILRMVTQIESAPENSLILIEEIENGLHPLAIKRLVEYLIRKSIDKKLQVIFTTHSQFALEFLPVNAIWGAVNGELTNGVPNIESLIALEGQVSKDLVIYCDDDFAKLWISRIMAQDYALAERSEVHSVQGHGNVIKLHNANLDNPATHSRFKSIAILDGDDSSKADNSKYIYSLPGHYPEMTVFNEVLEKWDEISLKLQIAFTGEGTNQTIYRLLNILKEIAQSNTDHHILFSQIADKLFLTETAVQTAFVNTWVNSSMEEVAKIFEVIKSRLN